MMLPVFLCIPENDELTALACDNSTVLCERRGEGPGEGRGQGRGGEGVCNPLAMCKNSKAHHTKRNKAHKDP